jgi:hypothetical protein
MGDFQHSINQKFEVLVDAVTTNNSRVEALEGAVSRLDSLFSTKSLRSPAPTSSPSVPRPLPQGPVVAAQAQVRMAQACAAAPAPPKTSTNALDSLKYHANSQPVTRKLKGATATKVYIDHIRGKPWIVSGSDTARVTFLVACFSAVTTQAEMKTLKARDSADIVVARLVNVLHDRFIGRMHQVWKSIDKESMMEKVLANWTTLLAKGVTDRADTMKKQLPQIKAMLSTTLTTEQIDALPSKPPNTDEPPKKKIRQ